ncbi:peptidase M16 [Desulfuromonas versatilis]|uniref:Peptidase M16 n=1 Tax=Desulfuromonas versatilis TaxID=2802975 RepID=A0ABN6E0A3_9BACT|nr:pitrilysin family protein [Desulfuromonas versatilis]BCR05602.1 peptidase M16 [Desulfuromonas versatilis]
MSRLLPLLLTATLLLAACAPATPRPDQLSFAPLEFHVPEVERIDLPSGIRLYLKEDHELPLVSISAMIGGGTIGDPADKTGATDLFASLLRTGGAGSMSPEELDARLEFLAAELSVAADTYAVSAGMSLRSADLREGVAILADVLRRPRFDEGRLELARKQAIEGIRRRDDDPGSVASRALMQALYGEHPLGRVATVESITAVARQDLVEHHRSYFHPSNLWLGITGDFDRGQLLELLQSAFGDWPRGQAPTVALPPLVEPAPPAVWVAEKSIPQTTIMFGEIGVDKDNPDLQAVRVMNYILGGGGFNSRLMSEVRSDRGLAYSVYSYYQVGRRLPGPFIAGCETKSESTLEVVKLMRRIMTELREQPVSEQELQLAKESLINSFVFAFEDSHDVITQKMRLDYYAYPEDYLQTYREKVAAVSVEDVLRVARRYLNPERQALVLVGDRAAFDGDPGALGTVRRVEAGQ